jgi:hypothetical protein
LERDLQFGLASGNMDLRMSALLIFARSSCVFAIPETIFYCDGQKHSTRLIAIFPELVAKYAKCKLDISRVTDLVCEHMAPSFVSAHRQLALELLKTIWVSFPTQSERQIRSVFTILSDASPALQRRVACELDQLCDADPKWAAFLASLGYVKRIESPENGDAILADLVAKLQLNDLVAGDSLLAILVDSKVTFSDSCVRQSADSVFRFFLNTKHQGMAGQCPKLLEAIARKLNDVAILESWSAQLLEILRDFDMGSMRRSASLPYIALALVRLRPSQFESTTVTLAKSLSETSNENEATNSLNVLRALLKDKLSSEIEEVVSPIVFDCIFQSAVRFHGWDFVTACNLCFAAFLRKVYKRSDQAVSVAQFFLKFPRARSKLVECLRSSHLHSAYLMLSILVAFKPSPIDGIQAEIEPYLAHRSSRMRRLAARALVAVSSLPELLAISQKAISEFATHPLNRIHGYVLLVREMLSVHDIAISFPRVDPSKLPPLLANDLMIVYDLMHVPITRPVETGIENRELLLLLSSGRDAPGLREVVAHRIQGKAPAAVFIECLKYAVRNKQSFDAIVIESMIQEGFGPEITALLIRLLRFASPGPEVLLRLHPVFEKLVYDIRDQIVPVHLAISEIFDLVRASDPNFVILTVPLLVSDIPLVRCQTSFGVDARFLNELDLLDVLLSGANETVLRFIATRWLGLIEGKLSVDTHGEPLCVLVDEFFVIRQCLARLKLVFDFAGQEVGNLSAIRPPIVSQLKAVLALDH